MQSSVMAGPALGLVSSRITSSRSHRSRIGYEWNEVNDYANALDHGDEGVATPINVINRSFHKARDSLTSCPCLSSRQTAVARHERLQLHPQLKVRKFFIKHVYSSSIKTNAINATLKNFDFIISGFGKTTNCFTVQKSIFRQLFATHWGSNNIISASTTTLTSPQS